MIKIWSAPVWLIHKVKLKYILVDKLDIAYIMTQKKLKKLRWYFSKMAFICPQCHTVFLPTIKEGFFANHIYATRKLICPSCGHHGFCVEVPANTEMMPNA